MLFVFRTGPLTQHFALKGASAFDDALPPHMAGRCDLLTQDACQS